MESADSFCIENKDQTTTNHNNNTEEEPNDSHKTVDQVIKHESSGSSSTIVGDRQSTVNEIDDMKRAHAKQLIERYFYQLSTGCGNLHCTNSNCASSGQFPALTPNQAAARSIQLYKEDAKLCDFPANKTPRISDETDSLTEPTNIDNAKNSEDFDVIYR